jgi:hypothetical protein
VNESMGDKVTTGDDRIGKLRANLLANKSYGKNLSPLVICHPMASERKKVR